MQTLGYTPLEPVRVARPVDRIDYIVSQCAGRHVLDLGCYDETALVKRDTETWLHGRIARVAASVIGVDSSDAVPQEGVVTGPRSRIVRGDVLALGGPTLEGAGGGDLATASIGSLGAPDASAIEVVVAGELIEHLPDTLSFLRAVKARWAGRRLILSTPNATSFTNVVLGAASRESNHRDHLQIYSFKTLHTLCLRAGFESWTVVPYHVRFTEMALRLAGARRAMVGAAERAVNLWERCFPLHAGGLILDVGRI